MNKVNDDISLKEAFPSLTINYKQFHGNEIIRKTSEIYPGIHSIKCLDEWWIDGRHVFFDNEEPKVVESIPLKDSYFYYCIWGEHYIHHLVIENNAEFKCSVFDYSKNEIEYLFKIRDDDSIALKKIKKYILSIKDNGRQNFSNGRIRIGKYRNIG